MFERSILLVDDNPDDIKVFVELIACEFPKYCLYHSLNAKYALYIAKKEKPDLIITDWEMPEMNGIDFISALKKDMETKDIPVIMCTGVMITSKHLKTALDAGAEDYIRKPVDKIEMNARITTVLRLSDSYKALHASNQVKQKIFSIISHDLRSPLGSIKGMFDMFFQSNEIEKEKNKSWLKMVSEQINVIYDIIQNLLDWSNIHRDKVALSLLNQPIIDLINNSVELLSDEVRRKNLNITVDVDERIVAYYDAVLIATVVRNLVANAIKYTPKNGNIVLNVEENTKEVIFSISDSGIGISEDDLKNIWEDDFLGVQYGTEGEKGTGLGLKICKEFVKMHNGKIYAESKLSEGSTFYFSLPKKSNI